MTVFENFERTEKGPAPHTTSRFAWINQCAEPYAERVRKQINTMMKNYPEPHQARLIARIQSDDDSAHRSAVLELTMHEWVLAQGHTVLAIEPELEHTPKSPDFLIQAPDGVEYYLEAVARREESDRLDGVRDALDAVDSPVYLDVAIKGNPTQTLSAKAIATRVGEFVNELDLSQDRANWPSLAWEERGARFNIRPFSLKSEKNRHARTVGVYSNGARLVASTGDLDRVLKTKAGRYGALPAPYVIAATTEDFTTGLYELTTALFGTEGIAFDPVDPEASATAIRNSDGIWRNLKHRWTNTGLSAVLLIPDLSMTSLAARTPLLMLHPEPRHAFNADWFNAEAHGVVCDSIEKLKDGATLGAVFDLPGDWPSAA